MTPTGALSISSLMSETLTRPHRHPEKAHKPDNADQAQAGVDSREGAEQSRIRRDAAHRAREQSAHGLRGSGLSEHRRVLGQAARHHDDHGRDLHAGLQLLQRGHGQARCARPLRADQRGRRRGAARLGTCCGHLGRPRRSGRRRRRALRADHPRHPRGFTGYHDRGADARLPEEGGRDRGRGRGAARRLQPQSGDRAAALRRGAAGRALLRLAAPARHRSSSSTRRCSPSPA